MHALVERGEDKEEQPDRIRKQERLIVTSGHVWDALRINPNPAHLGLALIRPVGAIISIILFQAPAKLSLTTVVWFEVPRAGPVSPYAKPVSAAGRSSGAMKEQ